MSKAYSRLVLGLSALLGLYGAARMVFAGDFYTLRGASGDISIAEDNPDALSLLGRAPYTTGTVYIDFTTLTLPDGDDTVTIFVQTTYNGGTDWVDVENIHFTTADDGTTATRTVIIDGSRNVAGTEQSITGTNPAAGAEISETVPANTIWLVRSISATLVSDANPADRRVRATLDDGTTVYYQVSSGLNHTASLTVPYSWSPFGAPAVGVVAATDATINIPLPQPTILGAGHRFITITGAMEAGDNWSAPQLSVESWHDPSIATNLTMGNNLRSADRALGTQVRVRGRSAGASLPTYAYTAWIYVQE